jgi:hypothetical protein
VPEGAIGVDARDGVDHGKVRNVAPALQDELAAAGPAVVILQALGNYFSGGSANWLATSADNAKDGQTAARHRQPIQPLVRFRICRIYFLACDEPITSISR